MSLEQFRAIHGRPRGFIEWRPQRKTQALVDQVQAVLLEYRDYLPLTIRQVFYRLVGNHHYEKTERAYERLCETMSKARRAGVISFDAIRDDGFTRSNYNHWRSVEALHQTIVSLADSFTLDRQANQPQRSVIWCEASGMVPMLERVAEPYSVPVYSSGGFDSVSAKYAVAMQFLDLGDVTVLHIGDHDPSGVHLALSLEEDVGAFIEAMGGKAPEFIRLAVTPDQVRRHNLPTAPAKTTDNRNFSGSTVQAEALPPDVLVGIVEGAILDLVDWPALQATEAREIDGRKRLGIALRGVVL